MSVLFTLRILLSVSFASGLSAWVTLVIINSVAVQDCVQQEVEPSMSSAAEVFLPRTITASVLVIEKDAVLILKSRHRRKWLVPEAIVQKGESPSHAAARICMLELCVRPQITRLLVVDFGGTTITDSFHFLFQARVRDKTAIKIGSAVDGIRWAPTVEALTTLEDRTSRRIATGLEAIRRFTTLYCEEGRILLV